MADFLSEASALRVAPEATKGTAPATGWQEIPPNAGSLSDFGKDYTDVERDTYDQVLMLREGDHVAKSVAFTVATDLNKDAADTFFPSAFRCAVAHFGGSGQSLFHPTAAADGGVAEDSFTVAAGGAVPNGVLIYTRGFDTAANNGLFVTTGTSTAVAIKVATGTLTAEVPTGTVSLDVVGFQGAAGDLELDASGNLTSTALDFTTLGIAVGMWIYLPSAAEATAMGSALYAFSVAAYAGRARVTAVAAHQLTLERQSWTIGSATTESTSTVRVFVSSRLYRNYPLTDASYARPTLHAELQMVDESGAAVYEYAGGCAINTATIAAPINNKIAVTWAFVGMDAEDPVASGSRKAGPSTAYAPLAVALVDTQNDVKDIRLTDTSGTSLIKAAGQTDTGIDEWTTTIDNKVTPKNVQATFGAAGHKYGKFGYTTAVKAYSSNKDTWSSVTNNTQGQWDVFASNGEYGFIIDKPNVRIRGLKRTLAADDIAMLDFNLVAFPNRADGIGCAIGVFGYLPTA